VEILLVTESSASPRLAVRVTSASIALVSQVGFCSEEVEPSSKVHSHAVGPPVVRSWKWMAMTGHDVGPVFGCSKREEKSAFRPVPPSPLQLARVTATSSKVRSPTTCLTRAATRVGDPNVTSRSASTAA